MKNITLSLVFIFISFYSFAQIQEKEAIDKIFAEWNTSNTPGAALGVVQDGKLVYSNGYGIGDLEHDIAITPTSVFYIGSVSKQFVTFAILLLEEQGKLNLDDNIQKHFPDFPEYNAPQTIRHFIHHTSGVRDFLTLMALKGRDYLDHIEVDQVYELIKKQKELNFTPGEKYLYSNSCYFMLAMLVEKVAGESLRDFAQKNMFDPLGMKSTLFYDDNRDLIKNKAFSYQKKKEGEGFNNLISRFDLVGSGGVYSSVEDLYLWDQNFYNNKLGKGGQAIIDKMHEEGMLNNGKSSGYAYALQNGTYKGLKTVSHGGALAGYRSQLMRFPEQNFSVIILANRGDANPTRMSYEVADILLKDEFLPEEKKTTEKPKETVINTDQEYSLNQLVGNYEVQVGMVLEISIKNDSLLVYQNWNGSKYNIAQKQGNTYEIPGVAALNFTFSELDDNSTQLLTVLQNGNSSKWNRKKQTDISNLNLDQYTGNFYSEEIDATYRFFTEENTLKLKMPNNKPFELVLYDTHVFTSDGDVLEFQQENGKITGFNLDAGRVQNLKFEKIK